MVLFVIDNDLMETIRKNIMDVKESHDSAATNDDRSERHLSHQSHLEKPTKEQPKPAVDESSDNSEHKIFYQITIVIKMKTLS